jgi:hypothetical protein
MTISARKPGQRVEILNGMGGVFDVKLMAQSADGNWQVRVDTPLNPDWHNYLIDGVAESAMRPVRPLGEAR